MTQINGHTNGTVVSLHKADPATPAQKATQPMRPSEKTLLAETYLDEHFVKLNASTGYYRSGASDAQGAEQSQLTLETFTALREEYYGELVDLLQLQTDLTQLREETAVISSKVEASLEEHRKVLHSNAKQELPADVKALLSTSRENFSKTIADRRHRFENAIAKAQEDFDSELNDIEQAFRDLLGKYQAEQQTQAAPVCDALSVFMMEIESITKRLTHIESSLPRHA